ncbi:alpha/beta fold hydrolase [Sphingomonas sp. 22176]|uniref:alpha/beta fold hydrolase n=1 Tax=Sphingomonas sp. 22176 TaxID=3453884 RepID=UPI003F835290
MTQKPNKKARSPKAETASRGQAGLHRQRNWIAGAAGVAVLAGSAIFNQASKRRAEAETPPEGSFLEIDGVGLHYVERGTGPAVVLLHGNGMTLQDYTASGVLGLATAKYRVIAFDRPGFGYSTRPRTTLWTPVAQARLIAKALEELEAGPAVVVGHSWGTLVALALALEAPAAVSGLVLLSGYYYGTARPDVWPLSAPAVPLVGDLMANTFSPLFGRLMGPAAIKASFSPAPVSKKFADFPIGLALRPSQVRATAADTAMMVPAAIEISRRYDQLKVRIIVMAGDGDRIAHIGPHAERFAGAVPNTELRIVPGQGHLFHYAVPEQVLQAIDDTATARSKHDVSTSESATA